MDLGNRPSLVIGLSIGLLGLTACNGGDGGTGGASTAGSAGSAGSTGAGSSATATAGSTGTGTGSGSATASGSDTGTGGSTTGGSTTGGASSTGGSSTGGGGSTSVGGTSTTGGVDGCSPNNPCANEDQFCDYPDDACGEGEPGTCTFKPLFCPDIWNPVCGCDNQTYSNECDAHQQGVDVQYQGECVNPPITCDPNNPCPDTHYCDYPDNMCGNGLAGTCKPRPDFCPLVFMPVCGCDGMTYDNACMAHQAGVDDASDGPCLGP